MSSKRFQKIHSNFDKNKKYSLEEALNLVKESANVKFVESVDLSVNLGLMKQKEQFTLRGVISLPHFKSKTKKIAAFVDEEDEQLKKLKEEKVEKAGGEDLIQEVLTKKKLDVDVVITTPKMMSKIARIAKFLGPKGLMPSPKTGTIATDLVGLVKKLNKGDQVEFRADKQGNINISIGKVNQKKEELQKNVNVFIENLKKIKPESWKGEYISKAVLSSTMGPGIKFNL